MLFHGGFRGLRRRYEQATIHKVTSSAHNILMFYSVFYSLVHVHVCSHCKCVSSLLPHFQVLHTHLGRRRRTYKNEKSPPTDSTSRSKRRMKKDAGNWPIRILSRTTDRAKKFPQRNRIFNNGLNLNKLTFGGYLHTFCGNQRVLS